MIVIVLALLVSLAVIGPIIFLNSRKVLREQKNYERGLKMVPLLIHLPPSSDDKEAGARDERELVDENISKAQILYTIIASTMQKGFKNKFYGQRHFAFEIVATHGFVKFYVAVPLVMVEVVKQAIISSYNSAILEEVPEHNIFSPVGKINGTVGGELTLKENYAYPIATYQDIKRDPIQSLLNSLSNLEKDDGVGIQIMLRPADSSWRKAASSFASKKRKGEKSRKPSEEALWWIKQIFTALWKPPEDKSGKDGGGSDKADLSSLDQAVLDAVDEKTRHAGYETLIRVVASSNVSHKSQAILANVVAAFSLYDAPGKNGFKFTPSKDIDEFVTAFILRFFPQQINQNILNAVELATLFHFPDQKNIPTSQLERQDSKQVDAPRDMPTEGLFIGYNLFRGIKKAIRISLKDRQRHMYIVGQTGTGKSTFMENLAFQDMLNGDGFAYIDPHGDGAEHLLGMVPKERTEDVIYFCPAEMENPLGLNMFEYQNPDQKDFLIQETINMLYKLYDPQKQGIIGPRYEQMFRMAALTIMADPNGGTFVDIPKLFSNEAFVKEKLKYVTDQNVLDFWLKEMPASSRSNDFGEVKAWFVSKFGAFLSNEMMRNIIGQTKSSFDLRDIMDNKKILIVNLSKGRTGDMNAKLLGMIFVMKFQAAAMSRANIEEADRQDFCLYVDEFQNFSTDSFATIMSEARKFHLNLIVGNQFTTQLTEEIRDAVFGNVGTIVSFRVGQNDVDMLAKYFYPLFDGEDLLRVPNYNAIARTLISGVPTQPFSVAMVPLLSTPNPKLEAALKQLSAAKYGRPRAVVEAEIVKRMATNEASRPNVGPGGPAYTRSNQVGSGQPVPRATGKASFLDEWLSKKQAVSGQSIRRQPPPASSSSQYPPQSPQQMPNPTVSQPIYDNKASQPPFNPNPVNVPANTINPLKSSLNASQPPSLSATSPAIDLSGVPTVDYGTSAQKAVSSTEFDKSQVNELTEKLQSSQKAVTGDSGHLQDEDTIDIDQEGNLHQKPKSD
ncbi:MAG TPA: ATP-binding protein [Candidatus Saccharibacteria bacterium]|nr:ATP-binding protein [Candidatus Saccharibacteria bacterium]